MRPAALAGVAVATAALAGCSGNGSPAVVTRNMAPPSTGVPLVKAPARDVAVVRRWVTALRAGRVDGAARWFAVPAIAQNGTPPLLLRSRQDVRAFNQALPCGAVLVRAQLLRGYLVATFRLTDRPGGDCGPGAGHRAATAFRIRAHRIVEWRRVPVPPDAPTAAGARRV